jgi:hypothetical protein
MADRQNERRSANQAGGDERDERDEQRDDAAREEQRVPRQGIPGKGFDAGGGYGGAGNDSAYNGESSYGGQAGYGGSRMESGYAGGQYGRTGENPPDEEAKDEE